MAFNVSKVTVLGRLAADATTREANGKTVVSSRVAANCKRGSKEFTTWYSFSLWDKLAVAIGPRLKKGAMVYIDGTLEQREYEKKDGGKGSQLEIHVDQIVLLDGTGKSSDSEDPDGPQWGR